MSKDAKKDKLWKPKPWLEKLREHCLDIPPEEHHAVDEIMIPFKGKSHLKVYMTAKPHKWGFKIWGRAGHSGFHYDFDICQVTRGVSGDVLKLTFKKGLKKQGRGSMDYSQPKQCDSCKVV